MVVAGLSHNIMPLASAGT